MQPNNMNMNQQQRPMDHNMMNNNQMMRPGGSRMPWIILTVVVVIALVVIGFLFRDKLGLKKAVALSGYQAVFLTNGQVYFGKVSNPNSRYVTLKDIYYLQVNQQQQLQTGADQSQQPEPQLTLVKLGNELHGPDDAMKINRDQILFFEDLKTDGKVAEAIRNYKANPEGTAAPQSGTPAPAQQTTPTK